MNTRKNRHRGPSQNPGNVDNGLADIEVPILDYVIPAIPDGYIPHQHLDTDLEVVIPKRWSDPAVEGQFDLLRIRWLRSGSEGRPPFEKRYNGPVLESMFPLHITISRDYLEADGSVELGYRLTDETGMSDDSVPRPLILDRTPPNNNVAPRKPDFLVSLIDETYADDHSTVDVAVHFYNGRRGFDRVYYWISDKSPAPSAPPDGFLELPFEDSDSTLKVPVDLFRLYPNGVQYLHIRLQDRSGNRGPASDQAQIQVLLTGGPGELKTPVIPAMANGLINRHDARIGVVAKLQYDNWKSGDMAQLYWANSLMFEEPVTQVPYDMRVSWRTLVERGLGPDSGLASYTIKRNGSSVPTLPSASAVIRWNFKIAGPDHRNAPQLLNPDLAKVTIYGEGSKTPNHIDIRDKDKRIYASVVLYENPEDGEVFDLYWGDFPSMDKSIASYTVDTSNGDAAGKVIELSNIRWGDIVAKGNHDKMPVYYTTYNGVNEQLSSFTEVFVDIVEPLLLEVVEFLSADDLMFINCLSDPKMWDHIPMAIPKQDGLKGGDVVVLYYQGYEEFGGLNPILGTDDELRHLLSDDEAKNGYVFKQYNYAEKIKPVRSPDSHSAGSSISAEYTVFRNNKIVGGSKKIRYVKIYQRYVGGGNYCGPDDE